MRAWRVLVVVIAAAVTGSATTGCSSTSSRGAFSRPFAAWIVPGDTPDQSYLADLAQTGLNTSGDPHGYDTWASNDIEIGHNICAALESGTTPDDELSFLHRVNYQDSAFQIGSMIGAAQANYCPNALTIGQSHPVTTSTVPPTTSTTVACPAGEVTATLIRFTLGNPSGQPTTSRTPDTATVRLTNNSDAPVQVQGWSVTVSGYSQSTGPLPGETVTWNQLPITIPAGGTAFSTFADPNSIDGMLTPSEESTPKLSTSWIWASAPSACSNTDFGSDYQTWSSSS